MPIGLTCALLRIPFLTHDSDTLPGLANRIVGKWAKKHAVGMPVEFYSYPQKSTVFTGIPVAKEYMPVSKKIKNEYRKVLNIPNDKKVVCVTGGSQGAIRLNESTEKTLSKMIKENPDIFVIHQSGKTNTKLYKNLDKGEQKRLICLAFMDDLQRYTGSADVVITRAGATTVAELSIQKIPCIIVPNPFLTGGHQLKNADHMEHAHAAIVLSETDINEPNKLEDAINLVLDDKQLADELSQHIGLLARPDAAKELANAIIQTAKQ